MTATRFVSDLTSMIHFSDGCRVVGANVLAAPDHIASYQLPRALEVLNFLSTAGSYTKYLCRTRSNGIHSLSFWVRTPDAWYSQIAVHVLPPPPRSSTIYLEYTVTVPSIFDVTLLDTTDSLVEIVKTGVVYNVMTFQDLVREEKVPMLRRSGA